ncbi:MAG: InlB B-repeat-containing protein [Clostridia bacterium]|jgi:uncharacterized repeat protein (TIGR02543 family)
MKKGRRTFKKLMSVVLSIAILSTAAMIQAPAASVVAAGTTIIVSSDSPDIYKNTAGAIMCSNGVIPASLKTQFTAGNGTFRFAPGTYYIAGMTLTLGSNIVFEGIVPIKQPLNFKEIMYPDSSKQAVFKTKAELKSYEAADSDQIGTITNGFGATNIKISNISLSGYTLLKLNSLKSSVISNVLIHNYRGEYVPGKDHDYTNTKGYWCNMGYNGATASLWVSNNCSDLTIQNCQVQFSSHHGFTIQPTGSNTNVTATNIHLKGVRALYCGNGQLKGSTPSEFAEAQRRVPETNGFGYYDWSTAYDLCENQKIDGLLLEDCYALEGWKTNYYVEPGPGENPTNLKNMRLIRCRADGGGQRNLIPGIDKRFNICQASEGANYSIQGGYFEDCISVNAEKVGWSIDSNRVGANPTGQGKTQLVRCGDMGSPISLANEMFDNCQINAEGFWSLNADEIALSLFGGNKSIGGVHLGDAINFRNTIIMAKDGQTTIPIRIGRMPRLVLTESRDPYQTGQVAHGGKYERFRSHITNSVLTGTIYNLSSAVSHAYIVPGEKYSTPAEDVASATFNGTTDVNRAGNGITFARQNTAKINAGNYVNDNWGRAKYTVTYNSAGGNAVSAKVAYDQNLIIAPASPKKTAYTFIGWYTLATGGTKIAFPYKVTGNVTLFAHWKVAKPSAPTKLTAVKIAAKTIRLKWTASTKVAGYSIYRSTSASGSFKLVTSTKYLTYTNKRLTAGKYYYFKLKSYRMNGSAKLYSGFSKTVRAKA